MHDISHNCQVNGVFENFGYGWISDERCPAFAGQAENKGVENFFAQGFGLEISFGIIPAVDPVAHTDQAVGIHGDMICGKALVPAKFVQRVSPETRNDLCSV